MSHIPVDPTKPKDPVLVARPRPGTVTLACALMLGGAAVGIVNALLAIGASSAAEQDFRNRTAHLTASASQINEIAAGLQTWTLTAGIAGLLLGLGVVVLAVRVLAGSQAARAGAVVFLGASVVGGLAWSSFTVRGTANLRPEGMDPQTGRSVADALGLSMSGVSTYIGGGLTCLQVLGYVAGLGLLWWPSSHAYFRRNGSTLAGG